MRICGVMRIRNEQAHIAESIESQLPLCEMLFIFNDHSTDKTEEICRSYDKVIFHDSPFDGLDEARDKTWILQKALEVHPDWVVFIDGDEIIETEGPKKFKWYMTLNEIDIISTRILYYWNNDQTIRTDGIYGSFFRPSAFRITKKDLKFGPLTENYSKGMLHCGQVPQDIRYNPMIISDIALWHYSAMEPPRRLERYQWYNRVDPNNYNEDCYRHAVQGDPGGPPAWMALKHAGPLQLMSVAAFRDTEDGRKFSHRPWSSQHRTTKSGVRSFDLFDTLIARRCVEPGNIGLPADLVDKRRQAEIDVSGKPYTLRDVYDRLGSPTLMNRELELERKNLFPIRQMTEMVKPEDIIVSDTCLPESFLQSVLLDLTGLKNKIITSNDGKYTGQIWDTLKKKHEIMEHIGDNEHSDVKVPQEHGIHTTHVKLSSLSNQEMVMSRAGFPGLARIMRETRLRTWDKDVNMRALGMLQSQVNFPVLFLASMILHRKLVEEKYDKVLMSARDCCLWVNLLEAVGNAMGGCPYEIEYFLTSRIPRAFPSDSYLEYFKSCLGEKTLVVDLTGTGWSMSRLIERAGVRNVYVLLLSRYFDEQIDKDYEAIGRAGSYVRIEYLLKETSTVAEKANLARIPMIADVTAQAEPIFINPTGADWLNVPGINFQHRVFGLALSLVEDADFSVDFSVREASVLDELTMIHALYPRYDEPVRQVFDKFFDAEDVYLWNLLREKSGAAIK